MPVSWSYWPFHFLKAACKLDAVTNSLLSSTESWAEHVMSALHRFPVQTLRGERGSLKEERELFRGGTQLGLLAEGRWWSAGGWCPRERALGWETTPLSFQVGFLLRPRSCSEPGLGWSFTAVRVVSGCFLMGRRALEAPDNQRVFLSIQN